MYTQKFFHVISDEKFPRLEIIRHKSDYDTFYIASKEDALEQVSVTEEVIDLVRKYLNEGSRD